MRLICPNCDAQYEVPEDVMPPEGRDVQCSNCGQTWFQDHPDTLAALSDGAEDAPQEDEEVIKADVGHPTENAEHQESTDDTTAEPHPAPMANVPTHEPEDHDTKPPKRSLDPAVTDVLREEAELETQARRSEATLESQPDLGLTDAEDAGDADQRTKEAQERMARMRGEDTNANVAAAASAAEATALGSRRDLLPDIEEINSTLRSNNDRSPSSDPGQTAQVEIQEKRNSRRGFILTIALVAVLALVYTYADQLAAAIPAAEPFLSGYVAMVDGWRAWLDGQVSSLLSWLDAAAVSSSQ